MDKRVFIWITCSNQIFIVFFILAFYLYPVGRGLHDLHDPALSGPGIPKLAWRLHQSLSPRYAEWANQRLHSTRALTLSTKDISGTEWPLFGSCFFLWGTENLQQAWEAGDHTTGVEPKVYAHDAIVAASDLVIDPKQAGWVVKHWGTNYLAHEDLFYRALCIAAMTSREALLHDHANTEKAKSMANALMKEIDLSPSGLLSDYPGECYSGDLLETLACIKLADAVFGMDHSRELQRAIRAFSGKGLDHRGLSPYMSYEETGLPMYDARGCGNSYICLSSAEVWPAESKHWFDLYVTNFWQEKYLIAGFREYAKDVPNKNWTMDVDAGPVITGQGVAASAFGIGAARINGRFDKAYPLSAEMLATIWELPSGTLGGPRLLSNSTDAPLLGEAGVLWFTTIQPQPGFPVTRGGSIPGFTWLVFGFVFSLGLWRIYAAVRLMRNTWLTAAVVPRYPRVQVMAWVVCVLGVMLLAGWHHWLLASLLFVIALSLPLRAKLPS
jgi:hypothetical protein